MKKYLSFDQVDKYYVLYFVASVLLMAAANKEKIDRVKGWARNSVLF